MRDPSGTESYGLGFRHALTFLVLLMGVVSGFLTTSVIVGIVSMTNKNSSNPNFEEFDWTSADRNAILSCANWGLLLGSLPAGELSQIMNVKYLAVVAVGISSIMTSLVPWLARVGGWQYVCGLVAIKGFIAGVTQPCSYIFVSRWAPIKESGFLLSLANVGTLVGSATGLPVMGLLAKGQFGWPSIFYVTTIFGLAWCVVFFIFATPSPAENKFTSDSEKEYIVANQEGTVAEEEARLPTPWLKLCTSPAVIVLVLGEMCNGFGSTVIMSELPSYVDDVLQLSIEENGLVSALPSVALVIILTPSAWVGDYLIRSGKCSTSTAKKLYTLIGMGINGALLIAVGFSGRHTFISLSLICLATACATLTVSGLHTVHLNIAPNFAGVLMGMTSFGTHISGVIAPLTVGQIVKHNTAEEWTWVFIETGIILIAGSAIFVLFGSTDLQSWNSPDNDEHKAEKSEISVSA